MITVMNLLTDQRPTIRSALELYREAIDNPDTDVRNITCYRLQQIGTSLLNPEIQEVLQLSIDLPDELIPKLLLLGHFSHQMGISPEARAQYHNLVLWLISNHPSLDYGPTLTTHALADGKAHSELKQLWLAKLQNDPKDTLTLHNAAGFFLFSDPEITERLRQETKELEPENSRWVVELALFYLLRMRRAKGDARVGWAVKALATFEELLSRFPDSGTCYMHLPRVARAALEAGETEKAKKYALDIFSKVPPESSGGSIPPEFFQGHLILGRLALKGGNKEEAKDFLCKAANAFCPGATPNMMLAKELLSIGERESVIEFVRLLADRWAHPYHLPDQWLYLLRQGKDPDFRAYLEY